MTSIDGVRLAREGRAGVITLDRPKALNALTLPMVRRIWPALHAWAGDAAIERIVLEGAGERGLCAGGDVRALYESRVAGSGEARAFWREEYQLNALISRYPKPFIPFMDGIVMGGGIGLSSHARRFRVVTERSRLAMPETAIGLIPDVGGTFVLSRSPGASGVYLGLLGESFGAADAIEAGFADVHVLAARLPELRAALIADGMPVEAIIQRFAEPPAAGFLSGPTRPMIEAAFSEPTVEGLLKKLEAGGAPWHTERVAALRQRSPKALKLTLAAIRAARDLPSLEAALEREFALCVRLFEDGEFTEGVRAALVDKDRKPRWRPATLSEVGDDLVASYLAPMPRDEALILTRS